MFISRKNSNRVVLVYADRGPATFPQGVLHLAASLRAKGFDPYILDTRVEEPTPRHFEGVAAVGISSMTGAQIGESLKVCSLIRAITPGTPIIWGGVHPTLLPEQTVAHPAVDFVVRDEGEESLCELLSAVSDGERNPTVGGITYRSADGTLVSTPDREPVNLDSIPPLPYDLLRREHYAKTTVYFPYLSSRGCPFRCTFCYNQGKNAKWRHQSIGRVIEDLARVNKEYGLQKSVHFLDDNLLTDPEYACALFDKKLREGLAFEWNGSSTIRGFLRYGEDQRRLLKRAGLTYLRFGAESGSPKIISQIRKQFSPDDAFRVVENCASMGIQAVFNFMVGFPGETSEDRDMTFKLIDDLHRRYSNFRVKTIWRLVVFPGTDVFRTALAQGFQAPTDLEGWIGYGFTNMPRLPWMTRREFRELEVINHVTRHPFLEDSKWSWHELRHRPLWHLLDLSSQLRWKNKYFKQGYEWRLRSWIVQKRDGRGSI